MNADLTRAARTAKSFTALGIQSLINCAKADLAQLDELDARLGDVAREAREAGRTAALQRLANAEAAMQIRLASDAASAEVV